jgi:NAD(P)-dependent dehydrogenase (short-subunit alcohol dehydrogenase family)
MRSSVMTGKMSVFKQSETRIAKQQRANFRYPLFTPERLIDNSSTARAPTPPHARHRIKSNRKRNECKFERYCGEEKGLEMADSKKAAIVTGASQGIGAELVEAFLKRGYNVVANSRNITKANPFPASANLALVDGDIGDAKTAGKIADTAVSRFGRIDVLINNAGIFIPKPFTEYTADDFNALVSTTLAGFLYISQLAVKQMLQQTSGSIVNVSTTLVDQPVAGVGAAVQVIAKGGLHAVTRALAIEYAKDGIRVNTVALGIIKTPMHKPETYEFLNGFSPVGRMGEIKEVVDVILFLTEDATFTTGEILHVDGGAHAGKW